MSATSAMLINNVIITIYWKIYFVHQTVFSPPKVIFSRTYYVKAIVLSIYTRLFGQNVDSHTVVISPFTFFPFLKCKRLHSEVPSCIYSVFLWIRQVLFRYPEIKASEIEF